MSTASDGGDASANGHPIRRAYGNARNASTLFAEGSVMDNAQAAPPASQVPDQPMRMQTHTARLAQQAQGKHVRKGTSGQVRDVLGRTHA